MVSLPTAGTFKDSAPLPVPVTPIPSSGKVPHFSSPNKYTVLTPPVLALYPTRLIFVACPFPPEAIPSTVNVPVLQEAVSRHCKVPIPPHSPLPRVPVTWIRSPSIPCLHPEELTLPYAAPCMAKDVYLVPVPSTRSPPTPPKPHNCPIKNHFVEARSTLYGATPKFSLLVPYRTTYPSCNFPFVLYLVPSVTGPFVRYR